VARPDPTAARFPWVPPGAGHYESFYLKLCDPRGGAGAWIRYTVHKRPGGEPKGSLWFTLFDAEASGPLARKVTLPGPRASGGEWIAVGEAAIRPGFAAGELEGAAWELRFESGEEPLFHLPRDWMYSARLPRTKLLSPVPGARFEGSLSVDGREIEVGAWRGMVGHNWGAQHAERWIWLHGVTSSGDWLDAAIGRVRLGPITTPWIANGAVSVGGVRQAVGGLGARASVRETPQRCEFSLPGPGGTRVRGNVAAARKDLIAWVYADPDGSEHHTANCSIADMRVTVERGGGAPVELVVEGGAAYELGMRERDHGLALQPFPDG
jgi:hypothetical protein